MTLSGNNPAIGANRPGVIRGMTLEMFKPKISPGRLSFTAGFEENEYPRWERDFFPVAFGIPFQDKRDYLLAAIRASAATGAAW